MNARPQFRLEVVGCTRKPIPIVLLRGANCKTCAAKEMSSGDGVALRDGDLSGVCRRVTPAVATKYRIPPNREGLCFRFSSVDVSLRFALSCAYFQTFLPTWPFLSGPKRSTRFGWFIFRSPQDLSQFPIIWFLVVFLGWRLLLGPTWPEASWTSSCDRFEHCPGSHVISYSQHFSPFTGPADRSWLWPNLLLPMRPHSTFACKESESFVCFCFAARSSTHTSVHKHYPDCWRVHRINMRFNHVCTYGRRMLLRPSVYQYDPSIGRSVYMVDRDG